MELLKGMENIIGKMEVSIRVILNMESGMVMGYGEIKSKFIKEVTEWIRSKDWEYINGLGNKSIKDSLGMILEKDTDSSIAIVNLQKNKF